MIKQALKWFTKRAAARYKGRQLDEILWQTAALYGCLGLYGPWTIIRLYLSSAPTTIKMIFVTLLPEGIIRRIEQWQKTHQNK